MYQTRLLASLLEDFTALASEDPRTLTEGQARSLQYFQAERAHSLGSLEPRERILRWVNNVKLVDNFAQGVGRLPRENNRLPMAEIDPHEQRLADWIRYQRRPATQGAHCEYQRRRLECIPDFSWEPRGDQWDAQLARFTRFIEETGRSPRYRADEVAERSLAAWVSRQRQLSRRGTLPADRLSDLQRIGRGLDLNGQR